MRFSRRSSACVIALALVASACGGAPETSSTAMPAEAPAPEAAPAEQPLATTPPVETQQPAESSEPEAAAPVEPTTVVAPVLPTADVVNLASGEITNLADLARPGPTLLWFWAPH